MGTAAITVGCSPNPHTLSPTSAPFTSQTCALQGVCISAETASAHVSFILTLPSKQLDFVDPPKDGEGKSAQDSSWGNSLADDCKVVGRAAAGGSASSSSMPELAVDSLCCRVCSLQ